MLRVTALCENTVARLGLLGEWGQSLLVETDDETILFDTGLGQGIAHNAQNMRVDLGAIDCIVLSHGHSDHTGGLLQVLQRKGEVEIIAHPAIWEAKYIRMPREPDRFIGLPFVREGLENLGASFNLTAEPAWISESIVTTGEVPLLTSYEQVDANLFVKEGGELRPDPLPDDRSVIIKTELGLVVLLGCAHRGAINILNYARELTGEERIYAAIGGFHLIRASQEVVAQTIADLKALGVERLGASHCTGMRASSLMAYEFGDNFVFNNAGMRINLLDTR